jgi:hypothetical protein
MKIELHFSMLFYAVVTEFVFGPVESGMTENDPSIGDMYSNI